MSPRTRCARGDSAGSTASEGHDAGLGGVPGEPRNAVGVQVSTHDDPVGLQVLRIRLHDDPAVTTLEARHLDGQSYSRRPR